MTKTAEKPRTDLAEALKRTNVIDLTAKLVRIPSHPGVPRQEEKVVEALAQYLSSRGLAARVIETTEPGRPNLLCSVKGKKPGRHLVLCGHTDTVPLNASDKGVGYSAEIKDGKMFGRGTTDMKGAVAAMAAALVALHETGSLPAGTVTLAAVADEEMKSIGAEHLVKSGFKADGAIVGEATGNALHLGHKGIEWLEIDFIGKAAHGGTPQAGINAILAAARFIDLATEKLGVEFKKRAHKLLGQPTMNFGTIKGGDQPSTVAAACTVAADRRAVPGESYQSICKELTQLLSQVEARMPGLRTRIRRDESGMQTLEHVSTVTDAGHPLAKACMSAYRTVHRKPVDVGAFPAWTDAALLAGYADIPSVVMGPGDLSVAHSPYEFVLLDELAAAARIYAEAALAFCPE